MTKRNSRIACLYIRYDPAGARHSFSSGNRLQDQADRKVVLFSHGNAVDIGQVCFRHLVYPLVSNMSGVTLIYVWVPFSFVCHLVVFNRLACLVCLTGFGFIC